LQLASAGEGEDMNEQQAYHCEPGSCAV